MNRDKDLRIRKFNPGTLQSDREVKEQFVVRIHELSTVLDILRGNARSPSCQHALIVAPRGRGKTMLLARTAAELRESDEFSDALLPVRFMEESQEIFNMADFWLETLFHLASECERIEPLLARELRASRASLIERWRNQDLEDHARNAVLDAADRLGRRLVLMVENLQALTKDVDADSGWKLRKVLQTEPQIMLLGSATSRFEGLHDASLPFFELFRIIEMKPLSTAECQRLWAVVSGARVAEREMRPLEILTGGSPRLLVIIAGYARHKSMRQLMEELVLLIDEHTEYFRGNLDALGKTERRVYLAVIDLWQSSTPSEISLRARMDIRKVSTMLGRLVNRGAVIVEGGGRKRRYAAAERLYSIYYKLRRGRDEATVVKNLIRFMAAFYTEAEQTEVFSKLIAEAAESTAIRAGLERAMVESPEVTGILAEMYRPRAGNGQTGIAYTENHEYTSRLGTEILEAVGKDEFDRVIELVNQLMQSDRSDFSLLSKSFVSWALLKKAAAQQRLNDLEAAASAYDEVIERFEPSDNQDVQQSVAQALTSKGEILRAQGNLVAAVSIYDEVVDRFGASESPELQLWVADALIYKSEALREANPEAAVSACDEVVDRYGASSNPKLLWWVALALAKKGHVVKARGDLDSAVSAFSEVAARFSAADVPDLRVQASLAPCYTGVTLLESNRLTSAMSAFEKSLELVNTIDPLELPTAMASALRTLAAKVMKSKSAVLQTQGRLHAAVDSFRSLYAGFEPDNEAMMREVVILLIKLVAAGVDTHTMLEIISSNDLREAALRPVIVALKQEAGEPIHAPDEMLQVAADIRGQIQEHRLPPVETHGAVSLLPGDG